MHHFFIRLIVLGIIVFLFVHYNLWDRIVNDAQTTYAKALRDLHLRSVFIPR